MTLSEENRVNQPFTCGNCRVAACEYREENRYPKGCLTANVDKELLAKAKELYLNDELNQRLMQVSAQIESQFYSKYTRVEETIEFIKEFGAKKVGIATCVGLINETGIFASLLKKHNIEYYAVGCKIGAVEKSEIGIPIENTLLKGAKYESMCNPIMQAMALNAQKTDLNIVIGLCVGHDSLFIRYSQAPVTVMIVKDRVTGHNPAVPLYTCKSIYSRI